MDYKRNQLEEAISAVVEPKAKECPSPGLQIKLKRLLEADRALKRSARASDPVRQHYAFFSAEPPGRGIEIWFTKYEVFALCVALQLLAHGWTPDVAARVMRMVRIELEAQHDHILRLYAEGKGSEFDFDNNPVLVVSVGLDDEGAEQALAACVRETYRKAAEWTWQDVKRGQGFAMFYLAPDAARLNTALKNTEPRRRGQPG